MKQKPWKIKEKEGKYSNKVKTLWPRETIKWNSMHIALTENLNSLPNTHGRWLTTTYDSISKGSDTGLGFVGSCTHLYIPTPKYT